MSTETQTTPVSPTPSPTPAPAPTPVAKGDTHSYKGWLNSDSFLKRAFAVYGYSFVASLIIMIPVFIIAVIVGIIGAMAFFGNTPSPMIYEDYSPSIEMPMVQGKLNINEICQGALAYTDFTDGASADAYVQDCIEGKHPEVIERYKADMGLGDGATI
jgi:hypothetical protein